MSKPSTLDHVANRLQSIADHEAETHKLSTEVVLERFPPIDIFVFGRSGIGKSQLIEAIADVKMDSSPQLDHVTQTLTAAILHIGPLTLRIWDTKGIDKWEDVNAVANLFKEIEEKKIKPIFVIYCAAAGGRVNSDIVTRILKSFNSTYIPICYVITNIYAGSSEQFGAQMQGGRHIMQTVFQQTSCAVGQFRFEYENKPKQDPDSEKTSRGLLIGVNSCAFTNLMGTMPPFNVHGLMDFLASNLNDEEFTKFVALTMNNRNFWDRAHDTLRSRFIKIKDTVLKWNFLPSHLVGWFSSRT
jgi:GTPase SAR1 family protein